MIYRISINLYRYEYRIEKTDRYPALLNNEFIVYDRVKIFMSKSGLGK